MSWGAERCFLELGKQVIDTISNLALIPCTLSFSSLWRYQQISCIQYEAKAQFMTTSSTKSLILPSDHLVLHLYLIYPISIKITQQNKIYKEHDKCSQHFYLFLQQAGSKKTHFSSLEKECISMSGSKWNRTNVKTMLVHKTYRQKYTYTFIAFYHNYYIWSKQILPICTLTCMCYQTTFTF